MKRDAVVIILFVVLALSAGGCKKGGAAQQQAAPFVSIQKLEKRVVREVYKATGTLLGIQDISVYSKINGKFLSYDVREGQYVEKDQVIARIDRDVTGLKYEPALIKSPISGIVGNLNRDKGEMIIPGQIPVASVSNMTTMEATISVPERYYPHLRGNNPVEVTTEAYPGEVFKGKIVSFTPVSDPLTHTIDLKVHVPNPGLRLRSGMFARISIILSERHGLALPEEAVIDNRFVFVYNDGKAHLREVNTGLEYNTFIEILDGLTEGEDVIVVGQKYIQDGMEVQIR
ncbi:efflux RND transporter periplasmic adaptor subunit [Candidatus Mcinerneyibacteriota bacterium]|nr:efflux RND transporter periplasmic adaptor subunit [Candidatus Mcinerneyibacteriota bacterium]